MVPVRCEETERRSITGSSRRYDITKQCGKLCRRYILNPDCHVKRKTPNLLPTNRPRTGYSRDRYFAACCETLPTFHTNQSILIQSSTNTRRRLITDASPCLPSISSIKASCIPRTTRNSFNSLLVAPPSSRRRAQSQPHSLWVSPAQAIGRLLLILLAYSHSLLGRRGGLE